MLRVSMKSILSTHAFSLQELKIISLWSVAAYLAGNVIGNLFLFVIGMINSSTIILFLPVIIFYGFAYGYCAFEAVKKLRGKTKLSGFIVSLYMAGIVLVLGFIVNSLFSVLGYKISSSNLAGIIGLLIGGYLADK